MPFDFFDGLGAVLDILSLDLGSSSKFPSDEKRKNKNQNIEEKFGVQLF